MNRTIVFLHPHFQKPGGASKVVLEQASGLIERGHKCIVVTTNINPEVTKEYPEVKIIELSNMTTGNLLFWFSFPLFLRRLIKTLNDIDQKIIYCHSLAIYWGYFYKKINKKVRLIYYLHDLGLPYTDLKIEIISLGAMQRVFLNIVSPVLKLFNKNIFSAADYIIANSKTSADYLFKKYSRRADAVVLPGVDTKIFKSGKGKDDYVYSVGRLEKSKSIDVIIKGFSLYVKKISTATTKLLIVGEGVEKTNLLKIVDKERIGDRVVFLGRKSSNEIAKLASRAKLGIFLGSYETFGIAAAESLACGTPVLGINTGGIKEIIGGRPVGKLVDGTPESVCGELIKMLNQKFDLNKVSKDASEYALQNLSWNVQNSTLHHFLINI